MPLTIHPERDPGAQVSVRPRILTMILRTAVVSPPVKCMYVVLRMLDFPFRFRTYVHVDVFVVFASSPAPAELRGR